MKTRDILFNLFVWISFAVVILLLLFAAYNIACYNGWITPFSGDIAQYN